MQPSHAVTTRVDKGPERHGAAAPNFLIPNRDVLFFNLRVFIKE